MAEKSMRNMRYYCSQSPLGPHFIQVSQSLKDLFPILYLLYSPF